MLNIYPRPIGVIYYGMAMIWSLKYIQHITTQNLKLSYVFLFYISIYFLSIHNTKFFNGYFKSICNKCYKNYINQSLFRKIV